MPSRACAYGAETRVFSRRARLVSYAVADASRGVTIMAITDISITDIADFADGHEFGAAGAYVRVKGVARGMLDPRAACNAGIVDLDTAPRNAQGLVDYATD